MMIRNGATFVISLALTLLAACVSAGIEDRPDPAAAPGPVPGPGSAPAAPRHPILAGAASRVITPEIGPGRTARLAGFRPGRDATRIHDDLYARALVLEAPGGTVALVALDLIGLFHDDVVLIREDLDRRLGSARIDYVMVASTHTHAGPDTIGLWTPQGLSMDAAYMARVRREAAAAVEEAWRRRQPARLSFAEKRMPKLLRDSRLPLAIDDLALLLRIDSADGESTIATLVNFANHPESLGRSNSEISSDYPWAARRELEQAYGGLSIFVSGAVGGLMTPLGVVLDDPRTGGPVPPKSFRMAEVLGETLGRGLIAAWATRADRHDPGPEFVASGAIEIRSQGIRVPLANQRFEKGLSEGRIWPRSVDPEGALTSEVAMVTLLEAPGGEPLAQIACVPGEIYPELVNGGIQVPQDLGADLQGEQPEPALRSLMAGRYKFVVGLCNDELGYIIPISQWDEVPPFAYGRAEPQYGEVNSTGPRAAPIILQAFTDLLR